MNGEDQSYQQIVDAVWAAAEKVCEVSRPYYEGIPFLIPRDVEDAIKSLQEKLFDWENDLK